MTQFFAPGFYDIHKFGINGRGKEVRIRGERKETGISAGLFNHVDRDVL
jgi:hypothetical protein